MIDRARLIILRTSLEKIVRKRGLLNKRASEDENRITQDLAEILDFLRDMEDNRGFWDAPS